MHLKEMVDELDSIIRKIMKKNHKWTQAELNSLYQIRGALLASDVD